MDGFNMAKCPRCRVLIRARVDAGKVSFVIAPTNIGQCRMCMQGGKVIVSNNLCADCKFGCQHVLRYDCEKCGGRQRIPHPMYRYQPSPDKYSTATWACHLGRRKGCGYTKWRIAPDDVARIPVNDRPESGGDMEEVFRAVRQLRERELRDKERGMCDVS